MGTVVDETAARYCEDKVNEAAARGAKLLVGNERHGALYSPTVVDHVTQDMPLVLQETFGPVSPVIRFDTIDDAIRLHLPPSASRRRSAPTGSTTSRASFPSWRSARSTSAKSSAIGSSLTPFGGIKDSGLGYKEGAGSRQELHQRQDLLAALGLSPGGHPIRCASRPSPSSIRSTKRSCRFQDALSGVEVLQLAGDALPKGLERAEAAAISWTGPPIDTILDAAPRLQWLHQRGAGIDRISTPKLAASDHLVLTNGSAATMRSTSPSMLGLMLAFARQRRRWCGRRSNDSGGRRPGSRCSSSRDRRSPWSAPAPWAAPSPSGRWRSACACSAFAARRPGPCRPGSRR
jgi:hypothetical protein